MAAACFEDAIRRRHHRALIVTDGYVGAVPEALAARVRARASTSGCCSRPTAGAGTWRPWPRGSTSCPCSRERDERTHEQQSPSLRRSRLRGPSRPPCGHDRRAHRGPGLLARRPRAGRRRGRAPPRRRLHRRPHRGRHRRPCAPSTEGEIAQAVRQVFRDAGYGERAALPAGSRRRRGPARPVPRPARR